MKLPRRKFLQLAASAAALPVLSRFAWAQVYPTRPVRIVVGFGSGSRLRQAHLRRNREVGQGGQVRRHKGGVICVTQRNIP
jgi:tripartite-type tricarboxylate transporter receptor subunit TctC